MQPPRSLAFIGFGEVGWTLSGDFLKAGIAQIRAWDIAFADPDSAPSRAARDLGVGIASSAPDVVQGESVVFSAVTAGADIEAARAALPGLAPDTVYVDLNSVSPGTKEEVARLIEGAGGRFVEAAVMIPIAPRGIASPTLLGGLYAEEFAAAMNPLGMDLTPYATAIGKASAVKMCRSVVVKGLEALLLESLASARYYGVERDVIDSLSNMIAGDWAKISRYMMSRALVHGRRRAEEMREVARTVEEAGLAPLSSASTAIRQDWAADQAALVPGVDWDSATLDDILTKLRTLLDEPTPRSGT